MSENSTNFPNYNLIYIDFDNSINIVKKEFWETDNNFSIDKNNLVKINTELIFLKLLRYILDNIFL